jgi:hypothetical protein
MNKRKRISRKEKVFSIRLRTNQGPFPYRMNEAVYAELFGGPCIPLGPGLSFLFGPNVPCQRYGKTSIIYTY